MTHAQQAARAARAVQVAQGTQGRQAAPGTPSRNRIVCGALLLVVCGALLGSTHAAATEFVSVENTRPVAIQIPGGALWAPPLGAPLRVAHPFRAPPHPYAAGHRGFDLASSAGAPILAPASGTVIFVGTVVNRPVVTIRVDASTVVSLEPVDTELTAGESVSRGTELGLVAAGEDLGGHCGTTCLHLGVRVDGEYVNPLRFFAGRPKLLPW